MDELSNPLSQAIPKQTIFCSTISNLGLSGLQAIFSKQDLKHINLLNTNRFWYIPKSSSSDLYLFVCISKHVYFNNDNNI